MLKIGGFPLKLPENCNDFAKILGARVGAQTPLDPLVPGVTGSRVWVMSAIQHAVLSGSSSYLCWTSEVSLESGLNCLLLVVRPSVGESHCCDTSRILLGIDWRAQ